MISTVPYQMYRIFSSSPGFVVPLVGLSCSSDAFPYLKIICTQPKNFPVFLFQNV